MSETLLRNARWYDLRAEEALVIAENMRDPKCSQIMLDIATQYRQIADYLQRERER